MRRYFFRKNIYYDKKNSEFISWYCSLWGNDVNKIPMSLGGNVIITNFHPTLLASVGIRCPHDFFQQLLRKQSTCINSYISIITNETATGKEKTATTQNWQLLFSKDPYAYENTFNLQSNCEKLGVEGSYKTLATKLRQFMKEKEPLSLSKEMKDRLSTALKKQKKQFTMEDIKTLLENLKPEGENDKLTITTWILMTSGEKNTVDSMLREFNNVLDTN